jgi:hypothetical protein
MFAFIPNQTGRVNTKKIEKLKKRVLLSGCTVHFGGDASPACHGPAVPLTWLPEVGPGEEYATHGAEYSPL